MSQLKWVINNMPKTDDATLSAIMSRVEEVTKAKAFHESLSVQRNTFTYFKVRWLSSRFRRSQGYDESYRFGLNAFKVLGGSYAPPST